MPEFIINIIYLILGAFFTAIGGFWKHRRDKRQLTESLERGFLDQYIEAWAEYETNFNDCFFSAIENRYPLNQLNSKVQKLTKASEDINKLSLTLWTKSSVIRSITIDLQEYPDMFTEMKPLSLF